MTIKEAAQELGKRSEDLYRMIRKQEIRAIYFGNSVRISSEDLDAYRNGIDPFDLAPFDYTEMESLVVRMRRQGYAINLIRAETTLPKTWIVARLKAHDVKAL